MYVNWAKQLWPTGDKCASHEYRLKLLGQEITSGGPVISGPESFYVMQERMARAMMQLQIHPLTPWLTRLPHPWVSNS